MTEQNQALVALAQEFRAKKDRKEVIEAELKILDADLKKLATETIPNMMDDLGVEKITVAGVGTIYQQVEVYAYVLKENEDIFHNWLRENGQGDLIRPYIFPATLKAFAKEQLEAGNELPLMLNAAKVPTARLRRK
jgi:hypothetical protein